MKTIRKGIYPNKYIYPFKITKDNKGTYVFTEIKKLSEDNNITYTYSYRGNYIWGVINMFERRIDDKNSAASFLTWKIETLEEAKTYIERDYEEKFKNKRMFPVTL